MHDRIKRRILPPAIVLLVLLAGSLSFAQDILEQRIRGEKDAGWEITADRLSHIEDQDLYVAEGNVVIKRENQTLYANKAEYYEKTGLVNLKGDVRLELNGDVLSGETGVFNLNTRQGSLTGGRLFIVENHYYINGDLMEKTGPETYRVTNFRLTTCEGSPPAWSITGSEVQVTVEGYGTVENAAFRIRGFPVFYLPWAIFPAKRERQTGLLPPRLGYSELNGAEMELPFFWAISRQTDATFYEHIMEERGLLQGLEYRYLDEQGKGVFLLDILSDNIEEKDLNDPEQAEISPFPRTNQTRYYLRGMADQELPWDITARLDADYLSDQDYLREFHSELTGVKARPELGGTFGRPVDEIYSPYRRSALRISREGRDYSLQALSAYYQRPENPAVDDTPQPLGNLEFQLLPLSMPYLPLFMTLNTDYDYIWRDAGSTGHGFSLMPGITYPLFVSKYLEVEPSIRFTRQVLWVNDPSENFSKNLYDLQTRFSSSLERVFDSSWGHTEKLKHKIRPSLIYQYRGNMDESRPDPWFEPIDARDDLNRIVLLLENFLDSKSIDDKGQVTYSQWGSLSLIQPYNIDEARGHDEPFRTERASDLALPYHIPEPETSKGERPFDPLVAILTLLPHNNLNLYAEAHWDHYDSDFSLADLSLAFGWDRAGGKRDRFAVDYLYREGENAALSYSLSVNLVRGFSVGSSLTTDLEEDEEVQSSYWIHYQSQCWGVTFSAGSLDGVNSVMLTFNLVGLGDIGR